MSTLETLEVPTPSSSLTLASIKQGIRLFAALWDVIRVWQGVKYGSAGKIEKMLARPRFYASVTCAFVAKNRVVLEGFRFLPALP